MRHVLNQETLEGIVELAMAMADLIQQVIIDESGATAIEYGWQIVTKDHRMRRYRHPRTMTIW